LVFQGTGVSVLPDNGAQAAKHVGDKQQIYRTIILPVVLHRCEGWSLTLREERKLRVFENMVLRRIFGPRRDEVTGNEGDCITRS